MSLTRRDLLVASSALATFAAALPARAGDKAAAGPFTLAPLPYPDTDLDPVISANTLGYHYGKHHQAYVTKLNELVAGKDWEKKSIEECMKGTHGTENVGIYNNSAQAWNHSFYWNSLRKGGGGAPPAGKLADAVKAAFGDHEGFKKELSAAATSQFGSGWAWLVHNGGKLSVVKTANADNPVVLGQGTPLLVIDVWEHAYYLDYQNRRGDYVAAVIDKLLNWEFASRNLG